MGMNYIYQAPTGNIHVDIDLSTDDNYYLSGQVWNEGEEKIEFGYEGITGSDATEPAISPPTLLPIMKRAILEAAQKFLEALD